MMDEALQTDYFIIAARILAYLYDCLKNSHDVDKNKISAAAFGIKHSYWEYIMLHLSEDNYVEGLFTVPVTGKKEPDIIMTSRFTISPEGIEALTDGYSKIHEAFNFLKTQNELIPEF